MRTKIYNSRGTNDNNAMRNDLKSKNTLCYFENAFHHFFKIRYNKMNYTERMKEVAREI